MFADCKIWDGFKSRDGYGIVHRKDKLLKAHRIAYCEFHNISLDDIRGLVVRHRCDTRDCVNPSHLEIGTSADNTRDRHTRGGDAVGSRNGNAKLSESDVRQIRAQYKREWNSYSAASLAKKYHVSPGSIQFIVKRVTWKHI